MNVSGPDPAVAQDKSAPGGSTPTSKSAQTRQRILDAAAEVLSRKGYAGTRLSDVAAVAGVQAPAIYYYFASRDKLVEEVMWAGAHSVRVHVQEVLDALPAETTPMDRLLVAVEAHLSYELQVSAYATASIRNAGHVPEDLRVRPVAEEAQYSRMWRDLFVAAQQAGQVRDDVDISIFRLLLLGAMNWVVEWWNPRTRSFDDLVATAQDMVRYGVGVPSGTA